MRKQIFGGGLAIVILSMAWIRLHTPAAVSAQAAPSPVVLVELFTSEGCSDCPPADALLRQIQGTHTASGQLIIALSEHVTYWNRLGWSDPFSQETFTARQNAYGTRFHLDSVYTPQMVVNGTDQFVGSDRTALQRAFDGERARPQIALHMTSAAVSGASMKIAFTASGALPTTGADIVAAITDDTAQSNVLRGENSGRKLDHVAVARSLAKLGTLHAAGDKTIDIPSPPSLSKGAHHIILFLQTPGLGPILGADTRPL